MILRSFRVENFKCFRDSGDIVLDTGFNIFVGKNNSGKSTFIQALKYLDFNKPHKSSTIPADEPLDPNSSIKLNLSFGSQEFSKFVRSRVNEFSMRDNGANDHNQFLHEVLHQGEFVTRLTRTSTNSFLTDSPAEHSIFGSMTGNRLILCQATPDKKSIRVVGGSPTSVETISSISAAMFDQSTFHFDAQRVIPSTCPHGETPKLHPNCANLARAIADLPQTPELQKKLNRHLKEIIPSIEWVTAVHLPNNLVDIRVSAYSEVLNRKDLLIPLIESGTGVGQVIAILYAAITFQEPTIILIDEPNSFLHPGAAKQLIAVLKQYPIHQYILTTHSADIIAAADPSTLHRIQWTGTESVVDAVNRKSMRELEGMLGDLGITMSDVFGANAILWVEGMTEQLCFPKLLRASGEVAVENVKPIGLKDTGRFDKAKPSASALWDAYEKLCKADALMPPTVAFCLDREGRDEKLREEISGLSRGMIRFLPRRNYECYLIHVKALAAALPQISFDEEVDISEVRVNKELLALGGERKFHASEYWKGNITDTDWLEHVDGAALLTTLFTKISPGKATFEKTTHSIFLTDWLIENDRDHIKELIEFVSSCARSSTGRVS